MTNGHRATRSLAQILIRFRWPFLLAALAATVVAYFPSQRLAFDRSIENMFAPDDPVLEPFRKLKRTFGGDEVALAAYVDADLLTSAGLTKLEKITDELSNVPGVKQAFSLSTVRQFLTSPLLAPFKERLLELSEGYTIGADRQTAGIVCVLVPEHEARVPRMQTVDLLRRQIETQITGGVLTGEPVMVVDGFRFLETDGELLGAVSTVLLMLTIVVCFRSLRWVVVPMAVVGTALVWTQAALVASHLHLSLVSSMLWAIVTVIGVATVLHLVISFREYRTEGLSPQEALELAGDRLAAPIFWACATDAAGFGALMVSRVGPVHDFGLMMLVGSLLALVSIALVVPGLSLAGRFDADPRRAWGEQSLDLGLRHLANSIERRPMLLASAISVLSLACCLGMGRLEVETDFTKNFRQSSPIVRSYEFVESRLGGAGVWDVIVPVPPENTAGFIEAVGRLEERLRSEINVVNEAGVTEPGLTKVLSAVDALDVVPLGKALAARQLEPTLAATARTVPIVQALYGRDPLTDNRLYLRIMLRAKERQPSQQKQALVEQVRRISREVFPEAEVTGFFVLLTKLIESTTRDQWLTFGVASAAIFAMMLAAFRSLPVALVTLIPNALPILIVTGLMGWLRLRINMGAAMIASVSMGLAVDSSIHYITAYRRHREDGLSTGESLHLVHQSVGRAMVFSTLALIVGFSALALSRFVPTIYFGVLVGLTMFGGLVGNLLILPLLLKLIDRESPKPTPAIPVPTVLEQDG
ncbi:MAG TPA: MMPL family transporter [Pirellulales bacterium]|nr:MMPL family transporter [Pirellulales bacterium]